jgi:hypothetical protein
MATIVASCVVLSSASTYIQGFLLVEFYGLLKPLYVLYSVHFLLVTVSLVRGNICKGKYLTVSK